MTSYVQLGEISQVGVNTSDFSSFPSLCVRHNGDLLCCYRGNANDHDIIDGGQNKLKIYNGATWSSESTLDTPDSGHDLREVNILKLATANYLLKTWIDVLSTGHSASNKLYSSLSTDDGSTWATPVAIDYSGETDTWSASPNKLIQLASGRILRGIYTTPSTATYPNAEIYCSDDNGANWSHLSQAANGDDAGRPMAEPSLCLLSNGNLLCLLRDYTASPQETWYSVSDDSGATWSAPAKAFNSSGTPQCELYDGRVYVTGRSIEEGALYYREKVWVYWCNESDPSTWYGPWEIRETPEVMWGQVNHACCITYNSDLVAVWSESQSQTDADLYWGRIATTISGTTVVAADSFDRDDGSDIGKCDGGTTGISASCALWTEGGTGNAAISNNAVVNNAATSAQNAYVDFDFGLSDFIYEATLRPTNSFVQVRFRSDRTYANGWAVNLFPGSVTLARFDSGSATTVESSSESIVAGTDYDVKIVCDDSSIEVYVDGALVLSTTSDTHKDRTATRVVLDNIDGNACLMDDFAISIDAPEVDSGGSVFIRRLIPMLIGGNRR